MDTVQERVYSDSAFRGKLLAWLAANGVEGKHVPIGERPTIAGGQLTIRLHTLSPKGNLQIGDDDQVLTHSVTVPVIVQPDADVQTWLAPCPSCGR